jgi:PHP family Zn ribbon phosphoesterase
MENDVFYIHSRCCNCHWELVRLPDGTFELRCERCGKNAGSGVLVTIIGFPKELICEVCEERKECRKK